LIDHIGNEKIPKQASTAVRNFGQWSKGWTGNLEERKGMFNKVLNIKLIMTIYIY
jgi:hypothetical protein